MEKKDLKKLTKGQFIKLLFSLAKPSIQRPNSNGVSRRFSKFESFTDQSGAEIKTTASTNR